MSQDYRDVARRYAEMWNSHDAAAIMAMHADDTCYQLHGDTRVYQGRTAVAEKFAEQLKQVPDIRFELKSVYGSSEHFVFESAITYTGKDGKPLRFDAVDLITTRDGLVVTKNTYMVRVDPRAG